jgi:hypothetical protein
MRSVLAGDRSLGPRSAAAGWVIALAALGIAPAFALAADEPATPSTTTTVTETPVVTTAPTATTSPASPESTQAATGAATSEPAGNAFVPTVGNGPAITSNGADLIGPAGETIRAEPSFQSPFEFSLTGLYLYGNVRGFAQISRGGKVGTSNYQRPQFHSIGISTANLADVELACKAGQYGEFFVGTQYDALSGAAYIGPKTLTSSGITYPKSSHVSSDVDLSWWRFGYRYPLVITTARNGIPEIVLTPYFEAILWTFDYNLTVRKARTANRSFDQLGFQLGGTISWRPGGGPLTLEATLGSFPMAANYATVSVERLDLRYNFYDWRRLRFSGLLGVTWEQQDFHDHQPLPNHISADFGPMLTAGLQMQF